MASLGELLVSIGADISELKADMSKASKTVEAGAKQMEKAAAIAGKALTAAFAGASLYAIKGFTSQVIELAKMGDELGDVQDAFTRLGGTSAGLEKANQVLGGTIAQVDLLKIANIGLLKGVPDFNNSFAKMADFAQRFAEATGKDAKESLELLTNEVANGSKKITKDFGIVIDKGDTYAKIIEKIAAKTQTLSAPTDDVSRAADKVSAAWDNVLRNFGAGVNSSSELKFQLERLAKVLSEVDWEQVGRFVAWVAAKFVQLAGDTVQATNAVVQLWNVLSGPPEIGLKEKEIANLERLIQLANAGGGAPKEMTDRLAELKGEAKETGRALDDVFKPNGGGASNEIKKQAEAIKNATKEWENFRENLATGLLSEKIKSAIDIGDDRSFTKWVDAYKSYLSKNFDQSLEDFGKKGVIIDQDLAENYRQVFIANATNPFMTDWKEKWGEVADTSAQKFRDSLSKALDEAGKFLSGIDRTANGLEVVFGITIPDGMKRTLDIAGGILDIIEGIKAAVEGLKAIQSIIGSLTGVPGLGGGSGNSIGGIVGLPDVIPDNIPIIGGLFAGGGVVGSPTLFKTSDKLGMMGEAGPEAILPLTKVGGELGVKATGGGGGGYNFYVDARGADSGVEMRIQQALRDVKEEAISGAVSAVYNTKWRGGVFSDGMAE